MTGETSRMRASSAGSRGSSFGPRKVNSRWARPSRRTIAALAATSQGASALMGSARSRSSRGNPFAHRPQRADRNLAPHHLLPVGVHDRALDLIAGEKVGVDLVAVAGL